MWFYNKARKKHSDCSTSMNNKKTLKVLGNLEGLLIDSIF